MNSEQPTTIFFKEFIVLETAGGDRYMKIKPEESDKSYYDYGYKYRALWVPTGDPQGVRDTVIDHE